MQKTSMHGVIEIPGLKETGVGVVIAVKSRTMGSGSRRS